MNKVVEDMVNASTLFDDESTRVLREIIGEYLIDSDIIPAEIVGG